MRTDNTFPGSDDDMPFDDTLADEAVDAADDPCPRADGDGTDPFSALPYPQREPRLAADGGDFALTLGDDYAAKFAAAAASRFMTENGAAAQATRGSFRRSTAITSNKPFDVDVIYVLTPPATDHEDHTSRLIQLLKHWRHAADGRSKTTTRIELKVSMPRVSNRSWWDDASTSVAGWIASRAVHAALHAREAVVQEDQESGRAVVSSYVSQWLGLKPTVAMVEAAGNALLQAPLDPYDPSPDSAIVKRLRSATLLQRRAWRPIGETWLRGRRVDSLDRPLRRCADDQVLTVADTVRVDDRHDVDLNGGQDQRIPRVLTQLRDDERDVAMAYAHDETATWAAAARACGRPEAFGERVRRKLLRLGKNLTVRLTQQHAVPRAA
ncbi:hypothetical protein [Micromonospora sp. WMMD1082]|uniref:hypothetical protein n=1 Tax=Micromonospora sp. WMMD1082 TaxID=3016104 RepID=UPI0024178F48|nr:hypothetical protein [Micromonospora sp. WMMD1082]MDG4794973.1 hypothetical protein [Micromonospora sp. WMMD1082]